MLLQEICTHWLQTSQETALWLLATVLWHMPHGHGLFILLLMWVLENFQPSNHDNGNNNNNDNNNNNNNNNKIIIIIIILKIRKIKIMLTRLILLWPSSNNKVKILGRSFISQDLSLTYVLTRPGSPKWLFCVICYDNKPYLILEQSLIGLLCAPWKQSMQMLMWLTGDKMKPPKLFKVSNYHSHHEGHNIPSWEA